MNSACLHFLPSLSPYVDGELTPKERQALEAHLTTCAECTGRVADFRAEAGLVRVGLEMLADEADFTGFSQKVMARITPERAPFWERWRLSVSELVTYQRGPLVAGLAMAAVLAVLVPVAAKRVGTGGGLQTTTVSAVSTDETAHVAPVVLKSGNDSIVWLVDHGDQVGTVASDGGHPERPTGGEL